MKAYNDQDALIRQMAEADDGHAVVTHIGAPPGCGKTWVFCFLAYAWFKSDRVKRTAGELQPNRIMYITAPQKQLVSEIADILVNNFASQDRDFLNCIAPLGMTPNGETRFEEHFTRVLQFSLPHTLELLKKKRDEATQACRYVKAADHRTKSRAIEEAKKLLRTYICDAHEFWESKQVGDMRAKLVDDARVILCTTGYKLKTDAGEKTQLTKIRKDKEEILHLTDEGDINPLPVLTAVTARDTNTITAWDKAQRLMHVKNIQHTRSTYEPTMQQNTGDWFHSVAEKYELICTSRFGTLGVRLLQHLHREPYKNLSAREDAPDTVIDAIFFDKVDWELLAPVAGGIGHWRVFGEIAHVVRKYCIEKDECLTICCVYAAFREFVCGFLQCMFPKLGVTTKKPTDGEAKCLVLTARQVRGSSANNVLALLFRRQPSDTNFVAQSHDLGKLAVLLSRMRRRLIVMTEYWQDREHHNDGIHRISEHLYSRRHSPGYSFTSVKTNDQAVPRDRTFSSAHAWMVDGGYKTIRINFSDEDDRPVSMGDYFTSTSLLSELENGNLARWQQYGGNMAEPPRYTAVSRVNKNAAWRPLSENVVAVILIGYRHQGGKQNVNEEDYEQEDDDEEAPDPPCLSGVAPEQSPVADPATPLQVCGCHCN